MNTKFANFIYILVAILTIGLIYWTAPAIPHGPRGLILPSSENLSVVKQAEIQIYAGFAPGAIYQSLGKIHVQSQYKPASEREVVLAMQDYAKGLATTVGAKGLVLTQLGGDPVLGTFFLTATAIE